MLIAIIAPFVIGTLLAYFFLRRPIRKHLWRFIIIATVAAVVGAVLGHFTATGQPTVKEHRAPHPESYNVKLVASDCTINDKTGRTVGCFNRYSPDSKTTDVYDTRGRRKAVIKENPYGNYDVYDKNGGRRLFEIRKPR